ncbi:hypothetical protein JCM3774_003964 [Rhodotorula dairenensis]
MVLGQGTGLGLRPTPPQLSRRHGRDPLTFTWRKSSKVEPLSANEDGGDDDDDNGSHLSSANDDDDSDPIENVTDSSAGHGGAEAAFSLRPLPPPLTAASQDDWYRFPAPTRRDAKRSTPYVDNVTRLKTKLAKVAAAGRVPAIAGEEEGESTSTEWDFKMVGQWRVGELLGKGTSGQVRLVRSIETGVFAALKRVINLPDDHKHAHSIHREICIMKLAANHPYLLQLYDIYETSEHYYILTEYTELGELFQYVQHNVVLPQYVHRFFCQLISAVAHLARFRICHRDIKLENIMLWHDEDGEVSIKLIDFGMATYQPEGELLSMSCGSPHYAAPEIMEGYAYDGVKSDTWSCGVVLYAMIARKLPFDDDDIPTLMNKVRIGKYEMPYSIQEEARDLVSHCLVKDPSERISLPELLAHPFIVQPISPLPRDAPRIFQRVDPPRAAYQVQEPLVEDIVSDVAMLLGLEDKKMVENQIRLPPNTRARLFYLVFLGYRTPSLVAQEGEEAEQRQQQHLLKSCFESSGPSLESTYSSGTSLRRSSSTPGASFPLPPLDDTNPSEDLVSSPQYALTGPRLLVLDDLDSAGPVQRGNRARRAVRSPRDASAGHGWTTINSGYVFPKPSLPELHVLDLPLLTHERRASSAPPLEAAPPQPGPVPTESRAISSSPQSLNGDGTGEKPLAFEPKGDEQSVPTLPQSVTAPEEHALPPLAANAGPTSAGQQVRPKASIHQRLRSIFSTQHARQKSTASAPSRVEKAQPPSPAVEPRPRRPRPHPIAIRWSVADPVAEADNEDERSPSSTHSAHSSLLKRSDAYTSFERAFAGKPPVSPVLRTFAALLEKGAPGQAGNGGKNRRATRDNPTFQVYEDPEEPDECMATPRASALNKKVLSPKGSMPAEEADAKRWRLLRKASSHVVGRVRQTVGSRPTSLVLPSRTDVTEPPTATRPISDVPAVTIEFASPQGLRDETRSGSEPPLEEPEPVHPWRSSTSTLSEAGERIGSRWRRSSLSIQVPAIEPRRPDGASTAFSPVFDLWTPSSSSHSQPATFAVQPHAVDNEEHLSRSLQATETENRLLRVSLQDKEAELEHLRARERSLADCLRTGNDMVRELSEERDELEERLRRISWYSCGGDPAWLDGGGGRGGKSRRAQDRRTAANSARSSPEAKWLGSSGTSPSDDDEASP